MLWAPQHKYINIILLKMLLKVESWIVVISTIE